MKNMKYILIAVAAMASAACAKEITPEPEQTPEVNLVPMTFTASADDGQDTKVFYDRETKTTQWKEGDKIMVISSTGTATEFEATSVTDNGKTATFEGLTENAETYYAVSPASAYKGDGKEVTSGTLYVNIPEVQTAVAGTFDPAAFVSVAKNDGGHLGFKNSCSIVRFNLKNPEGVKSVRFTANDVSNLAGTQNVLTSNIPSHSWGSAFDGRTSHGMITLNAPAEGFKASTDYYMTMRPQTMAKGINLYIEYADAVKVRKGTSEFPASMNTIRDLKTLDEVTLEDITPYDSYQMGFDLVIGGKIINKATYGPATLISSSSTSKGLNSDGVYFIDSDVEGVSMNSSKSIVAIGNNLTKRSKITRNGYSYIPATAKEDYWILSNIEFEITTSTSYSLKLNGGSTCETIIMENCFAAIPSAQQFIYGDGNNYVKNIMIKDSEFLVGAESSNNFLNFAATQTADEITFVNNVFYSADIASPATNFVLISASNTTATKLTLNKNTFYGAYTASGGFITNCKVTDVKVTKNLFGLRSDASANVFVIGGKISGTMNFSENGYYKNNAAVNVGVLTVGTSNASSAGTNDSIGSKGIDTSGWNPAEGKFTLNNGFGATR